MMGREKAMRKRFYRETAQVSRWAIFMAGGGQRCLAMSVLLGFLAIFCLSANCAGRPGRLAREYGTSFKLAKFNQILTPEAEKNLEPATGFDGGAAKAALGKYRKGFEEAAPAPAYPLEIGGIGMRR